MKSEIRYDVIGLMSGTSLDGLDIAHCTFQLKGDGWHYTINSASTISYGEDLRQKLSNAINLNNKELIELDFAYGRYLGEEVKNFLKKEKLNTDFISSHGHTVFHQPDKGITLQIGNAKAIQKTTGLTVVNDFRSLDVQLGGQGAPLVPIGDRLLFSEFDYCINLGGFINISTESKGKRIARDICPFNIVLNKLARKEGFAYDENGRLSANGKIIPQLLNTLNSLDYYFISGPASLGVEWVNENFEPLLGDEFSTIDVMRTVIVHSVEQLQKFIAETSNEGRILLTGGGVYNNTFIGIAGKTIKNQLFLPSSDLIEFKEALVFAFLGVLRMRNEVNTLASVTGASKDSSGGSIFN